VGSEKVFKLTFKRKERDLGTRGKTGATAFGGELHLSGRGWQPPKEGKTGRSS